MTPADANYFRLQAFDIGVKWMIVKATTYKGWCGYNSIQQRGIEDYFYVPYENYEITNNLTGKYLIDFGDSIERGDGTNGEGIGYLIAKRNKMAFTQFSCGGETVGESTSKHYTYDREYEANKNYYSYSSGTYTKLIEGTDYTVGEYIDKAIYQDSVMSRYIDTAFSRHIHPDYIMFNGGTNDISYSVPLGEMTSLYDGNYDETTFTGAFEKALYRFRSKWPDSKILYIRVHNMVSRNAEKQKLYGEMALAICKKWSVKVCNIYSEGGLNTNISIHKTKYTVNSDGTHPNAEGYEKFYVNPVEQALLSI